jgi:DNA-binding response OmpR family regulator
MRVLIVEDEKKVASFIKKGLQQEGYAADAVYSGAEACQNALLLDYDLVVLDLMLPEKSGLEVLREIRAKKPNLPVLVLTAKGAVDDKVAGLDAGADDYLIKPFAFAELSARIRALLRRGSQENTKLKIADLEMDTASRQVRRGGQAVDLKLKEYALLEFLLRNVHRPVTRTMIVEHVWDIHFDSISNVVDVHINSLRNKIDKGYPRPLIHTVRGVGYMLSDRPS